MIGSLSDEFNGDVLDKGKWIPKHPYWSGRNSTHTVSNVSVRGGNLRLKSTLRPDASEVKAQTVTAACVTSSTPRCHYGYYQARIKCSDIKGRGGDWWDANTTHNPTIHKVGSQYALFYLFKHDYIR